MSYSTSLFSKNLKIENENDFGGTISIASCSASALTKEFGSPLFVLDQADFADRVNAWQQALTQSFTGGKLYYAA
ncbi:MAG: diaminopimelate decarboxylase, partial [Actinobacteria bacterium]|nr:diaminopimelate decarboxylase [Actinomycetota bacterium]